MSSIEAEMNELQTRAFIERKPSYIVIRRPVKVSDGAGGTIPSAPAELSAQKVRAVREARPRSIVTEDGRQVEVDLALVGTPEFDVLIGDEFDFKNRTFEVVDVPTEPDWRTIAEAVRRGD